MDITPSEKMFREYKIRVERHIRIYQELKDQFPNESFPKLARNIWRMGMLTEIWGLIASRLSASKRNYLREWGSGE